MAVKPELSHVSAWDEGHLTWTLTWSERLTYRQIVKLVRLRKRFMDMKEIHEAPFHYYPDSHRLKWLIRLEASMVRDHTDAERQHLEQLIEMTIERVLFGNVFISTNGAVTDESVTRPTHTHVV